MAIMSEKKLTMAEIKHVIDSNNTRHVKRFMRENFPTIENLENWKHLEEIKLKEIWVGVSLEYLYPDRHTSTPIDDLERVLPGGKRGLPDIQWEPVVHMHYEAFTQSEDFYAHLWTLQAEDQLIREGIVDRRGELRSLFQGCTVYPSYAMRDYKKMNFRCARDIIKDGCLDVQLKVYKAWQTN